MPRSRGTTTRQTTPAVRFPLFFSTRKTMIFFKSAQRVSCHARVVPLINRVPRFSLRDNRERAENENSRIASHSVSDLPTDTPRRQEKERERTNASSTPAGMSKSPAENNSSLDKTSALERLPVKKFLRAADEEQCTEAACHPVGERGRVRPELSFSAIGND